MANAKLLQIEKDGGSPLQLHTNMINENAGKMEWPEQKAPPQIYTTTLFLEVLPKWGKELCRRELAAELPP